MPWQTLLGGKAMLAWVAFAGVAGGAVGATLEGSGAVGLGASTSSGTGATAYHRCPSGPVIGHRYAGDRVFATGRTADGQWIQIRSPRDVRDRVWVPVTALDADGSFGELPERSCPQHLTVEASFEPDAKRASPTPSASPSPSPEGDEAGDGSGPSITQVTATPRHIYEHVPNAGQCDDQNVSTIRATVTDPSGVAFVNLRWSVGTRRGFESMERSGSAYTARVGPFDDDTVGSDGANVVIRIVALDNEGNDRAARIRVRLHDAGECVI